VNENEEKCKNSTKYPQKKVFVQEVPYISTHSAANLEREE